MPQLHLIFAGVLAKRAPEAGISPLPVFYHVSRTSWSMTPTLRNLETLRFASAEKGLVVLVSELEPQERLIVDAFSATVYLVLQTTLHIAHWKLHPRLHCPTSTPSSPDEPVLREQLHMLTSLCIIFIESVRAEQGQMTFTWVFPPLAFWWALRRGGHHFTLQGITNAMIVHAERSLPEFSGVHESFRRFMHSSHNDLLFDVELGEKRPLVHRKYYDNDWQTPMSTLITLHTSVVKAHPQSTAPFGRFHVSPTDLADAQKSSSEIYLSKPFVMGYIRMLQELDPATVRGRVFDMSHTQHSPGSPLVATENWGTLLELLPDVYAFVTVKYNEEARAYDLVVMDDHQIPNGGLADAVHNTFASWHPEFPVNTSSTRVLQDVHRPIPEVAVAVSGIWAAQRAAWHVADRSPPVLQYSRFRAVKWAMISEMYAGRLM